MSADSEASSWVAKVMPPISHGRTSMFGSMASTEPA